MTSFQVQKVKLTGVHFINVNRKVTKDVESYFTRGGIGKGAEVTLQDQRKAFIRLNDLQGVDLTPSLKPDNFNQTFLQGPVLERAERILTEEIKVAERLELDEKTPMNWDGLSFNITPTDAMVIKTIASGGQWSELDLVPFDNFEISPAAGALNYGQSIFEGVKAFISQKGRAVSFRTEENAKRLIDGARRLGLTPVPIDIFMDAFTKVVRANERWIPPMGKGALYIRPVLFGSGPIMGVAPAPENTFMIYVTPVGPYFKGGLTPIDLLVSEKNHRAAPGGSGAVKASGNYAPGMVPAAEAKAKGFAEVIYLDAEKHTFIEEVGAANFFFVSSDGVLHTPELTGTILPGITRKSIMEIARNMGMVVKERKISIDEVLKAGNVKEAFCTGTAAVLSPIGSITRGNITNTFNNGEVGPVSKALYETLTGIQEERVVDEHGWVYVL